MTKEQIMVQLDIIALELQHAGWKVTATFVETAKEFFLKEIELRRLKGEVER